ncbi:MAG: hypothetical protein AAGI01_02575 [Myxococcota bacterium]
MRKQLALAIGMLAMAMTFSSGCLVVAGDGRHNGACYDDCYDTQVCDTYCDPWECWEECWYETTCTTTCEEIYDASADPASAGAQCASDIDCAADLSCVDGACKVVADQGNGKAGLCQTCEVTSDCFESDARCVRLNYDQATRTGEKVCSRVCEDNNDCAAGFECIRVSAEVGVPAQCLPTQTKADGERTCNAAPELECVKATDCEVGESCVNNACTGPNNAECSSSDPCPAGETCRAFECVAEGVQECIDRTDCSNNSICVDGSCIEQAASCVFNSECDGGKCVDGQCADMCSANDDCGPFEMCRQGLCEQIECRRSADCEPGNVCVDANCIAACDRSSDCADGYVCAQEGFCDADPTVECRSTAECQQNEICMGGACQAACACNQDCPNAGDVCDLNTGTCSDPGAEAPTTCASNCDCPAGEMCTPDGACAAKM